MYVRGPLTADNVVQPASRSPGDAPIHLLPDDVLEDIFFLCIVPNDERQTFFRRTPSYSYRISLSSVCRRWRGVIQAMPRLWANIVSDATEDYPPMQLFHLITERSYPSVIHVDVWGAGDLHTGYPFVDPDSNPGARYPNLVGSLKSLAPHMYRCQRLKAFVTDADVAYAFAQIPFSSAGRLEELEVATRCGQDVDNHIFSALRGLTALHRLTLIGFGKGSTIQPAMPNIPWHQLLYLDFSYPIPTEEVFWLLQACTSATKVRIKAKMQVGYRGPPILTPNLQTLSLSVCGRNIYRSLKMIEAPNLEVFCLETRREASIYEAPVEIPSDDQFVWPGVLNRGRSLKVLVINDPGSSYAEAIELMSHEYIQRVPTVQIGIRPVEMREAQRSQRWLGGNGSMLGWVNEGGTAACEMLDNGLFSS